MSEKPDIVERLRRDQYKECDCWRYVVCEDAAAEIERLRARLAAAEKVLEEIATPDTDAPFYILIDGKRVLVDEHAAVQWRMDKARAALNPPA